MKWSQEAPRKPENRSLWTSTIVLSPSRPEHFPEFATPCFSVSFLVLSFPLLNLNVSQIGSHKASKRLPGWLSCGSAYPNRNLWKDLEKMTLSC